MLVGHLGFAADFRYAKIGDPRPRALSARGVRRRSPRVPEGTRFTGRARGESNPAILDHGRSKTPGAGRHPVHGPRARSAPHGAGATRSRGKSPGFFETRNFCKNWTMRPMSSKWTSAISTAKPILPHNGLPAFRRNAGEKLEKLSQELDEGKLSRPDRKTG